MHIANFVVAGAGALAGVAAALLWLWGSLIAVPDNLDTFISVLQRIGRLNAYAALAAAIGATCAAYLFIADLITALPS